VESEPGIGSMFSFELIFETIDAPDDMSGMSEIRVAEKPCFDGLILICEDNPMNQQVICDHLASVGLQTVTAENGKIGVEMVQTRMQKGLAPFNMIFMDIFMPVMDGVEAASKITALKTGTPIVAMTANVMNSEMDNYRKSGMNDCVGKPFTTQELWRCLLKYLSPKSVSVIDRDVQAKDNDELQEKLRVKFVKDNNGKFAEIGSAIAAGDERLAHRLAHTLKTNAGMIGMARLQNTAAEIESLLNVGLLPEPERMKTLESELNTALGELRPLHDAAMAQAGFYGSDKEQVWALFEKLELMLENINPECVKLLDEIRSVPGTEELARQIEDYDFESAARTLGELRKGWVE
jgi:CheY-like chemotaxis protein